MKRIPIPLFGSRKKTDEATHGEGIEILVTPALLSRQGSHEAGAQNLGSCSLLKTQGENDKTRPVAISGINFIRNPEYG
jgi:hypothetical protein